jgi:hypothetical protein
MVAQGEIAGRIFNSIFSAFFERSHIPVERIGLVFALSQLG